MKGASSYPCGGLFVENALRIGNIPSFVVIKIKNMIWDDKKRKPSILPVMYSVFVAALLSVGGFVIYQKFSDQAASEQGLRQLIALQQQQIASTTQQIIFQQQRLTSPTQQIAFLASSSVAKKNQTQIIEKTIFVSAPTSTPNIAGTSPEQTYEKTSVNIFCDNDKGGSGFMLVGSAGLGLTNNHVVAGAKSCLITFSDLSTGLPSKIYRGEPLIVPVTSQKYDIAMFGITGAYIDSNGKAWGNYPSAFPSITESAIPGNCGYNPKLGDAIRIYGYPITSGGNNLTITEGIISSFTNDGLILTSAKIDSGNSGGLALTVPDGCFIGMPSAVIEGNYQNLGVIIPFTKIYDFFNEATQRLNL